jgi:threonine/homoserine/homoserine lactone efflux protein
VQLPVDPTKFWAFFSVMMVMAATPGPANLFAVATGMERGKRAALVGILGMSIATLVWFTAAAAGLGALILAFPKLFHLLTFFGAAYLIWLGSKSLWSGIKGTGGPIRSVAAAGRSALRDGFVVQISNPKALVLFSAVIPPFLEVDRPIAPQMFLFAAATIGMDMITMTSYGLGGAAIAQRMTEPRFQRVFAMIVGLLLISASGLILFRH